MQRSAPRQPPGSVAPELTAAKATNAVPRTSARKAALGVGVALASALALGLLANQPGGAVPTALEPAEGVSQCAYDLLAAFVRYAARRVPRVRYTIGSGTLLGAMRNTPPGLLQWEHDIDIYIPAR